MLQRTDEFWDDFLEENAAAEAAGTQDNFAEKMANLEKNISDRIDEVEKSLINTLQEEAKKPNYLDPFKNTEQDPAYNDDEEEGEEENEKSD